MKRCLPALLVAALLPLLHARAVSAGFLGFGEGIGPSMYYGPYPGGNVYRTNVAYGYGLIGGSFNSWSPNNLYADPLAYPAGPYAYPIGPYPPRRYVCPTPPPTYTAAPDEVLAADGAPLALRPVPGPGSAIIRVTVPANAEVWVEGNKTEQTGSERAFRSPPLPAGARYVYLVRARWTADGHAFEQIQPIDVTAGQESHVAFPRAPY